MYRFFEDREFNENTNLKEETIHHLKNVIRIEDGEAFQVVFEDGIFSFAYYDGKLKKIGEVEESNESKVNLSLFFGVLKNNKSEDVLRHATEIGVSDFYPVLMDRTISDISKKKDKKKERYQKIVESASKQSKRDIIPMVHDIIKTDDILKFKGDLVLCYEDEDKTQLGEIIHELSYNVGLVIGPEGGISDRELEILKDAKKVGLGKRILRAETAAITASFYIIHAKECE
ncbi:RsmE family RNA methyltransferase [Peptoniphilus senegalensis]|uniref:Ribosomal RNA small subunit methyltransferase E n=1 Tax=Peptoniphilus senegalensis TaxID=1465757 RepID=A0ABV1J0T2_9FIRM|nr:RsmE family RNA methyltransferase [Peptoniphilus senegalensis]CAG7589511.1 Ribosomal RNA small subunit methyltransferase E [Peptoniphilus tyrrelliae]